MLARRVLIDGPHPPRGRGPTEGQTTAYSSYREDLFPTLDILIYHASFRTYTPP